MEKIDVKEQNKKKKTRVIISIIFAIILTMLTHLRLGTGKGGFMEMMGPTWGYVVLLFAVFLGGFIAMFSLMRTTKLKVELTEEEKKKKRNMRTEIIFVVIDVLMTGSFIRLNWDQISAAGLFLGIAEVAAFFAIVWIIFEFFDRFKFFPERILKFLFDFLMYVCVPMLFLLIILLGAYQAKYGYDDLFRGQIGVNSEKFASVMQDAYYKLITAFYDIGQSNPELWIWLPVVAFFIMTLWLLYSNFTRPIKKDEDKTAQEIIDESLREQLEEEDYEAGRKQRSPGQKFIKKINDWMKTKLDKEKEEKEKLAEKNAKYKVYDIKLIELKGGKG